MFFGCLLLSCYAFRHLFRLQSRRRGLFYFFQLSLTCLPMDNRVRDRIVHLVSQGIKRVGEMQKHLSEFIKNDLFSTGTVPPLSDARFWPSNKTVMNCIYRTVCKTRYTFYTNRNNALTTFLWLHMLLISACNVLNCFPSMSVLCFSN